MRRDDKVTKVLTYNPRLQSRLRLTADGVEHFELRDTTYDGHRSRSGARTITASAAGARMFIRRSGVVSRGLGPGPLRRNQSQRRTSVLLGW